MSMSMGVHGRRLRKIGWLGAVGLGAIVSSCGGEDPDVDEPVGQTAQALICSCPSDPTTPNETCPADTACITYACQTTTTDCQRCAPTNLPATTACNDSNACTSADHCDGLGACVAGPATVCNDNNGCTLDSCNAASGCVHTPQTGAACNDGNPCTTGDACTAAGGCAGAASLNCDDNNACTADSCDPTNLASPCQHVPLTGAACNDANACTSGEKCSSTGTCGGGVKVSCNDSNPCTKDSCSNATGCVYTPNDGVTCSDNNVCTLADKCAGGACGGGTPLKCDDNNPCTADSCSATGGCVYAKVVNGTACDDENGCTTGDVCTNGVCAGTGGPTCNDNNPCTRNSCSAGKCSNPPEINTTPCDDGNKCTLIDACIDGSCKGSSEPNCDDNDPCTIDSCDPATGCVHTLGEAGECNDKDPCTENDTCSAGKCAGTPMECPAPDDCHEGGSCEAASGGCVYTEKPDGSPCDGGKCASGACVLDGSGSGGTNGSDGGVGGTGGTKDGGVKDGGESDEFSPDESGCDCRTASPYGSSSHGLFGLVAGLTLAAFRRLTVRKARGSRR